MLAGGIMALNHTLPGQLGLHPRPLATPCRRREAQYNHSRVRVQASGDNGSEPPSAASNLNGHRQHLPMSMYKRLSNLPFDGRTLTTTEESCDPYEELCKTPLHVWETKCKRCYGTGHARVSASRGRGGSRARGSLSICLVCSGLGYVRHVSSEASAAEMNPDYTIGRDPPPEGPEKRKPKVRLW